MIYEKAKLSNAGKYMHVSGLPLNNQGLVCLQYHLNLSKYLY